MLWDTLDPFLDDSGQCLVTIDRCLLGDCGVRSGVREDGIMVAKWPWPKEPDTTLNVAAFADASGQVSLMQKAALDHLVTNAPAYEARILTYFEDVVQRIARQALDADFDEVREWLAAVPGRSLPGVRDQLLLDDIYLHSDGWDGIGCITFDFYCGWEEEHGVSLLMHTARVIAEGGRAEFGTCEEVLGAARGSQKWQTGFDIALP